MTATAATADRGAPSAPVRRLTVLYDAHCPLCAFVRDWLARQRQLVPLDLVPAGTQEAHRRLPELDHTATLEEITVVGDGGQVYRGAAAWVVCLWALDKYRPLAHKISTPSGLRFARGAVLTAAKYRQMYQGPQRTPWETGAPGSGWASPATLPAATGCRSGCAVPD
ncbi:thiol-disulfide oxidoreductase DCC family protein [Streptomyces noursei]|uniref:thiol-disulfide oxidoreductase DCC family protein n=1 Tax=Streptomyces noursei TaxID=1971 RepID=UPI00167A6CFA|nr:DUF393 domain-containing protein [Streptomyces noursei]MCZ1019773.1 DUF393 domain-containing protein [Streptomyces noursei]GGX36725.1 hypothetical protein GCM10010341_67990 [Streptomyces noursei]